MYQCELENKNEGGTPIVSLLPLGFISTPISDCVLEIERSLTIRLSGINYGPSVEYIYNPFSYAFDVHSNFVKKYCNGPKKVLFLGMNPGPWGMMQNGIPFGETNAVRDFLRVFGAVHKPEREHPARPVLGFACRRSEVSGKRFWALANHLGAGDPFKFLAHSFIYNYFPFCLLNSVGKNVTPPELQGDVQKILQICCDSALCDIVTLLGVEVIVAVGRYVEKKASAVLKSKNLNHVKVVFVPHPSPRHPGNTEWVAVTKQLILDQGLTHYFAV